MRKKQYIGYGGYGKNWQGNIPDYAQRSDKTPFFPHEFENKIVIIGEPFRVLLTPRSYSKMWHYVNLSKDEISWLGTCLRQKNDFIINETFLLKQECGGASTEISREGLQDLATELLSTEKGMEIWNNIRFWGHSHVDLSTSSSYTDDKQMEVFKDLQLPFFIRGIFNKFGKIEFTIYLYDVGIMIQDVPWSLAISVDDELRKSIEQELKEKVKPKFEKPQYPPATTHSQHIYYYGNIKESDEARENGESPEKFRGDGYHD